MRATLKTKIVGLVILAALLPVIIMMGLVFRLKYAVSREADEELNAIARRNISQVARDATAVCELSNSIYEQKQEQALRLGVEILNRYGWSIVASSPMSWEVEDQDSGLKAEVALPRFLLNGQEVQANEDFRVPALVVDEVSRVSREVCTIFQRVNDRGDMLRIISSVPRLDGRRAVGTLISASMADGTPNPVIAKILKGESYRGTATILKEQYLSTYQPLKTPNGEVVGMLFVGEKFNSLQALRKQILGMRVGQTGYVFVLGTQGATKGIYIISKDGERDGENIWDSRDSTGRLFIQDLINDALHSKTGEEQVISYPWKNPGEAEVRMKVASAKLFAPWGWIVGVGVYEDDFTASRQGIETLIQQQFGFLTLIGFLAVLVAGTLATFLAGRLIGPLNLIVSLAEKISLGNLVEARKDLETVYNPRDNANDPEAGSSLDEIGQLLKAFSLMTANLFSLTGQVHQSGIAVTTSTTQIASSARQLEASVSEQAAATQEVTATSREISNTSETLSATMRKLNQAVADTGVKTDSGRQSLARMEKSLMQLEKATSSISSKLGVINDKTNKISTVVTTINKISDQTNLLSLNAAIEAEKAGEYGRGFAVVSREIGRLADQTAWATEDIERMVREMRTSVSAGVMEMDKFAEEVRREVSDVAELGGELGRIIDQVRDLGPQFDQVSHNVATQSQSAQQISEAMSQLSIAARQNKEALVDFKQATDHLRKVVEGMKNEVARFRLE